MKANCAGRRVSYSGGRGDTLDPSRVSTQSVLKPRLLCCFEWLTITNNPFQASNLSLPHWSSYLSRRNHRQQTDSCVDSLTELFLGSGRGRANGKEAGMPRILC